MSVSLQCYIYVGLNICMCYSVKVMMLRFVVLLTLTVTLAECRVSVLTYHRQYYVNNNVLNCSELNEYYFCADQHGVLFIKICEVKWRQCMYDIPCLMYVIPSFICCMTCFIDLCQFFHMVNAKFNVFGITIRFGCAKILACLCLNPFKLFQFQYRLHVNVIYRFSSIS